MPEVFKKNPVLTIISSLLFGSSVSLIITEFLINRFGINLLSFKMPGVSEKLAYDKTFDILDFVFAGVITLGFFLINHYGKRFIYDLNKKSNFKFAAIILLLFSIVTFIQTHFLNYSSSQVLIMVGVFEALYFLGGYLGSDFNISAISKILTTPGGKLRLQNGIFLGFLLTLLTNNLTTIPALSLMFLFLTPLLFLSLINKKAVAILENTPGFLFVLAMFFPNDQIKLSLILVTVFVLGFLIKKYKRGLLFKNWITSIINPALILIIVIFNPTFYIGNFDSVEEGFWLAWVQRLIQGDVLYKDVAVYHSPIIPWGMYLFSKISGFNLYSERLFLHLLQVLGGIIFFFFSRKVIGNTFFAIACLFVYLAVTATLVRNNIEIRLGISLLSLIAFFGYFEIKKNWLLIVSGVVGGLALMLSIESGLVALITIILGLNIFSPFKFLSIKNLIANLNLLGGVLGTLLIFGIYLLMNGSFAGFFEFTGFYANAFSQGYFNSSMERSVMHSYFHFDVFDEYLDSVTIFWESTKLTFIGFLVFGIYKFFSGQKISLENIKIFTTAFFGLLLTRAALGRSDWYHLLFVLGVALVLVFYGFFKLYQTQKLLTLVLMLFLIFVMARPSINNSFLDKQFFKYESYGKIFGDYKSYYFDRGAGALVGEEVDTKPVFEMVEYIQLNSDKQDKIFVYPWNPEIYFYTDRGNATRFDTPYGFFSDKYQDEMINSLKNNPPKFIVFNSGMNFGGLTTGSLNKVTEYIGTNYKKSSSFGPFDLLVQN